MSRTADRLNSVGATMQPVDFLKAACVPRFRPGDAGWREIRKACGRDYEAELSATLGEANDRNMSGEVDMVEAMVPVWPIMFHDVDTALATHVFSAHVTRAWLDWSAPRMPTSGRLVDVGCGPGIVACWHAINAPDLEVVGIDREASAVKVARDLAARLELDNVTFEQADWNGEFTGLGTFDHAISVTGVYGDLPDFDEIAATYDSPAEVAGSSERFVLPSIQAIGSLLDEGGTYMGLERIPTAPQAAVLWYALRNVGLAVDVNQTVRVPLPKSEERMPVTVAAARDSTADPDALLGHAMRLWDLDDLDPSAPWLG